MRDPRQTVRTISFRGTADSRKLPSSRGQVIDAHVIEVLLHRDARAVGLVSTIDGPRLIVTDPPEYEFQRDAFGELVKPKASRMFALVLEGGTVDATWRFIGTIEGCILGIQLTTLASLEHSELIHVFEVVLPRLLVDFEKAP